MIAPADLAHCRAAIRTGSLSFHAASRLLPPRVRDPALALYAFCRLADDEVDEGHDKGRAVLTLRDRLDLAYRGQPRNAPEDRAFTSLIEDFDMPRALPEALLEGLAWDATGRRYATLSGVLDYSARVAAAVGAMMCVLMRVRDADTLARACDLGLAMQLTNIARDVGEDARAGRLYLPLDWLAEEGIDAQALLADPVADDRLCRVVRRLLAEADGLYLRAGAGVAALPPDCRPGIYAARQIYGGIGMAVARNGHDSVTRRARTGRAAKLGWLALATGQAAASLVLPRAPRLHAVPVPEVAFLVAAAARAPAQPGRADALLAVLAQLEAQDRRCRAPFAASGGAASLSRRTG
jgi:phytoene synthase